MVQLIDDEAVLMTGLQIGQLSNLMVVVECVSQLADAVILCHKLFSTCGDVR